MSSGNGKVGLIIGAVALVALGVVVFVLVVWQRPPKGARVLVIGDSVTYQTADDLVERIDWTDRMRIKGWPGYRTDQILPPARAEAEDHDPQIGVFMTGYNDLTQEADTDEAVVGLMDLAGSIQCSVWLLLPTKGAYSEDAAEALNDRFEELADERGVHVVTDWRDAADDTDGAEPDPELVSDDGIHPTDEGQRRIADIMASAVEQHCNRVN